MFPIKILSEGHNDPLSKNLGVKQFRLKILCSYLMRLKLFRIVKDIKQAMNMPLIFNVCTYSREIIDVFPDLAETLS